MVAENGKKRPGNETRKRRARDLFSPLCRVMALSKFSSSECEFIDKTSKDFDCPVCLQIAWKPFLTACCGNHFCDACVKSTKEKSDQCPFCNEKPMIGITDKKFQRQINELQVYCLYKKHGCLWVGELGKLDKHLEEGKIDGECKFVLLSCSLSCGKQIFRCDLGDHLTEECSLRTCTCEYCGYSSTYDVLTTTHYSNCPDYPVVCPNFCSKEKLKRSSLDHHLLDCPDEVVSCSFNEMGCEKRMKRQCLQQHIEANMVQHQLMICDAFKNVKKENETLKEMLKHNNEDLRKSNAALKSVQRRVYHATNGLVLNMTKDVTADNWKEYFVSLSTFFTGALEPICPVIIKWSDYSELKQIAKDGNTLYRIKSYYTCPFFTHYKGYKMQIRVYPFGDKKGNSNMSLYLHLMRGENDDTLKWPFEKTVTISLLNQLEDSEHLTRSINFSDSEKYTEFCKRPNSSETRSDTGWGFAEFISLSEVESTTAHKQYLMNDALYFKISSHS